MERGQFGWENEEDEDDEMNSMQLSKSHSIFLIDASVSMQTVEKGCKISPFQATIMYLVDYLTIKVKHADSDEVGIIFYGTKQSQSNNSIPNIFVFNAIDKPDVEQILKLQKILDPKEFENMIGSAETFSLFDSLSECAILLKRSPKKVKRFVYLISNEDDPCKGDAIAFSKTILKAQDLVPLPISLEIFGIHRNGAFSYEKFYHKLTYFTYLDEDEQEFIALSSNADYHDLQSIFKSKEFSKRCAFSLPFNIGKSIVIGIKGFNQIMEMKKASYTYVDRVSGIPVSSKPVYISEKSGKLLKDWDYYYEIGGEKILFSKEEIAEIKSGGAPGLQLLGFRDFEELKIKFNIKRPVFIIPDDNRVKGSSSFFAHFLEGLYGRQKIAICSLVPRKGAAIRIVALIPQLASFNEKKGSEVAAGFHLVFLPFSNELRAIDFPALEPKQETIEAAISLIEAASMDYDLGNNTNPVLNRHFALLKNIALNESNEESISDDTIPNYDYIFEHCSAVMKAFNSSISSLVSDEVTTLKRQAIKSEPGPKKKLKSEPISDLSVEEVKSYAQTNTLKKLTVEKLVGFLSSHNEKIKSKKKADLLAQVEAFIESQG